MRLPTRHIYRAFPELDPYTDERCERFIRAARGAWARRLAGRVVVTGAALLAGGGVLWAAAAVGREWLYRDYRDPPAAAMGGAMAAAFLSAALCGLLARDLLLRRRVRSILRTRGRCAVCGYLLVGCPVSPARTVTCPECAHESDVDPSLGELVVEGGARPTFRPGPAPGPWLFTPLRLRRLKRAAVWASLLLGVGIPSLLCGYELWLRWQASVARSERPGVGAIIALVEAQQPPGSGGGANAWDHFPDATALRAKAEAADASANPIDPAQHAYPAFDLLHSVPEDIGEPGRAEYYAACEAYARRLLVVYAEHGLYDLLERMAAAPRAVPMVQPAGDEPLDFAVVEADGPELRLLARICWGRMALAREGGDVAEYASALRAALALSRMGWARPSLVDAFTAMAIEQGTLHHIGRLLVRQPGSEWLDAIASAVAGQHVAVDPAFHMESERILALDRAAWVFSDPSRVRWGMRSLARAATINYGSGRLGTYRASVDQINARFDAGLIRGPRWESRDETEDTSLWLVNVLGWSPRYVWNFDSFERSRRAHAIMMALERYRIDRGVYPAALGDLLPDYLTELPRDPISLAPWGYTLRRPDARPDDPRGYILYSYGPDAADDGGRRSEFNGARSEDGFDHIINDWEPPPER